MGDQRTSRWRAVAGVLATVLALAACQGDLGGQPAPVPTPDRSDAVPAPNETRDEDGAPETPDEPLDDDADVRQCDDAEFAAVDGAVGDQLAAFSDGDWERAYALASDGYRQSVSLDEFAALIEQYFPVMTEATSHTSTDCLTDGTRATLQVAVAGRSSDGAFLYLLVHEDGTWRVSGATASAATEPGQA